MSQQCGVPNAIRQTTARQSSVSATLPTSLCPCGEYPVITNRVTGQLSNLPFVRVIPVANTVSRVQRGLSRGEVGSSRLAICPT